jgi:hypothetical protein
MTDTQIRSRHVNNRLAAINWLKANPDTYLFPIAPGKKTPPLISDNLNRASNDPKQIKAWATKWPNCNWGIALKKSNRIVIDVDCKVGKHGQKTFDILGILYELPPTVKVITPSGGFHLYYKGEHVFALGERGFGRDIDSPNYTLIPGCQLADGSSYRYAAEDAGFEVPSAADAPSWFYELLGTGKLGEPPVRQTIAVVDLDQPHNIEWCLDYIHNDAPPAIEGQNGDMTTVHVAMVLRDHGLSEETAFDMMQMNYNIDEKCIPLWSFEELKTKVANAFAYAMNAPGSATAEHDFADDPVPESELPQYVRPNKATRRVQANRKRQRKLSRQLNQPVRSA